MGNEIVTKAPSYTDIERMATNVVKSGFFGGVKTQEQAIILLMIADADGIKPIEAVMQYDVIGGKPALKAYAMLSRFQAAGGRVEWLEASDEKVSGRFTHPAGGSVVVTWDTARVTAAGLLRNPLHKTNPQQMKRARCISEGVRATFPSCTPIGVYTKEELEDIAVQAEDRTMQSTETVVQSFEAPGLPATDVAEYMGAIQSCTTMANLKVAYQAAFTAAKDAKDERRIGSFTLAYEARKAEIAEATSAITAAIEAKKAEGETQI